MDNAGNCNTTASELGALLPRFRGTVSQTRCFPHILNLIAKVCCNVFQTTSMAAKYSCSQAILLFFFKQYKRKKAVKVGTGTKQRRGHTQTTTDDILEVENELVVAAGEEPTGEDQEQALNLDEEAPVEETGQQAHNDKIVRTLKVKATSEMAKRGIQISTTKNTQAIALFPKVCDLHTSQLHVD
jgi:hypothetical protein